MQAPRPPRRPSRERKRWACGLIRANLPTALGRWHEPAQKIASLLRLRSALEPYLVAPEVPMHDPWCDVGELRLMLAHQLGKGVADGQRRAGKASLILMSTLRDVVYELPPIIRVLGESDIDGLKNKVRMPQRYAPGVLPVDGFTVISETTHKGRLQLSRMQAWREVNRDVKVRSPALRPLDRGDPECRKASLSQVPCDELRGVGAERTDRFHHTGRDPSAGMTRNQADKAVEGRPSKKRGLARAVRRRRMLIVQRLCGGSASAAGCLCWVCHRSMCSKRFISY